MHGNDKVTVSQADPSRVLAVVIEEARQVQADGKVPTSVLKQAFITALERLIRDAMGTLLAPAASQLNSGWTDAAPPEEHSGKAEGEPAFQALVLRHRSPQVEEYVSLSGSIRQDRQQLVRAINAVAHPGKLQHMPTGWQRDAMAALQRSLPVAPSDLKNGPMVSQASAPTAESHAESKSLKSLSWAEFADALRVVLTSPDISTEPMLERHLTEILNNPALQRLQRFETLATNQDVCDYLMLQSQQGPRAGSTTAAALGSASRQRGQAVEDKAAQVFRALLARINCQQDASSDALHYQLVTAMHAPSSLTGGARHAKTEWDVVVLERMGTEPDIWDLRLLVEVKASADAAVIDFPRLVRGLELLAQADADQIYTFETAQGRIKIRGASLVGLSTDDAALKKMVRYWCDAPPVLAAQALNPANRMRLLSAPACVAFASLLSQGRYADPAMLEAVWDELLESPRLRPVLHHFPLVQIVQGLTISPVDMHASNEQGGSDVLSLRRSES